MANPPGHLWRDKWTALSGPLSQDTIEKCQEDFGKVECLLIVRPGKEGVDAGMVGQVFVQFGTKEEVVLPYPEYSRANSYPWSPFPPRRARPGPGPRTPPPLMPACLPAIGPAPQGRREVLVRCRPSSCRCFFFFMTRKPRVE